jgi:tetratricopeptide (TPR) repeat protein
VAQARRQFAARTYTDATRTVEAALALAPSRGDEAEARILLADIAQASGELALAARRYTAVADTFTGGPAAESALYAAARIELRRGRTAAARTLLARYLDRHPAGRYADDVRRELDALPPAPP